MYNSFMSVNLNREVSIGAYVPSSNRIDRVFIMLHGYGGSWDEAESILSFSEYADRYNVLIVMPGAENRFYIDRDGWCMSKFLSEELPDYVIKEFNLNSDVPVVIGGYSMGGNGAMLNGLKNPSRFSGIVSVSGAFIAGETAKGSGFVVGYEPNRKMAFELLEIEDGALPIDVIPYDTKRNPVAIVNAMDESEAAKLPPIIVTCGTLDWWYESSRDMSRALERNGVEHTYYEVVEGNHLPEVFDECFRYAFDVLFGK